MIALKMLYNGGLFTQNLPYEKDKSETQPVYDGALSTLPSCKSSNTKNNIIGHSTSAIVEIAKIVCNLLTEDFDS